jgi:hypothetical protein
MMKTMIAAGFTAALMMAAPATAQSLTTTFAGGNSQNGNIFDVLVGNQAISLNSLGLNVNTNAGTTGTFEFYFRQGTSTGFQSDAAGWTLFSTNTAVSAGSGAATAIDITNLMLDANTRYGLYFTQTAGSLSYTNGTGVGNVAATNGDLTVFEGYGSAYRFGGSFEPRVVNATFEYTVAGAGAVPEPATWAMMIGGIGMVGGAMRRRKVSTTVSFA